MPPGGARAFGDSTHHARSHQLHGESIVDQVDGELRRLVVLVVGAALDAEMTCHLGYGRHAVVGRHSGNSRNGVRPKTLVTDLVGAVEVKSPRDRDGTFAPRLLQKRRSRATLITDLVLTLLSTEREDLDTSPVVSLLDSAYGFGDGLAECVAQKVIEAIREGEGPPIQSQYAALLAFRRDGRPVQTPMGSWLIRPVVGVDLQGRSQVLDLWAERSGESRVGATWGRSFQRMQSRGMADVYFVAGDFPPQALPNPSGVFPSAELLV